MKSTIPNVITGTVQIQGANPGTLTLYCVKNGRYDLEFRTTRMIDPIEPGGTTASIQMQFGNFQPEVYTATLTNHGHESTVRWTLSTESISHSLLADKLTISFFHYHIQRQYLIRGQNPFNIFTELDLCIDSNRIEKGTYETDQVGFFLGFLAITPLLIDMVTHWRSRISADFLEAEFKERYPEKFRLYRKSKVDENLYVIPIIVLWFIAWISFSLGTLSGFVLTMYCFGCNLIVIIRAAFELQTGIFQVNFKRKPLRFVFDENNRLRSQAFFKLWASIILLVTSIIFIFVFLT
jgi:hypothetical protein